MFSLAVDKTHRGQFDGDHFPILRVNRLCKHFPICNKGFFSRQTGAVKAVDQVSFDLMRGETLGIVGESGSGKTTIGRCLLRAIAPTSGEIFFDCYSSLVDLCKLPAHRLKPLRTKMQMIFQDPFSSLNPRMTVRDIVAEPLVIHRMAKGAELEDRVDMMLKKVGLKPEYKRRYPHAFSGGQRQRVGIARALIMEPSLVVADEPVSALDVSVQAQVINLLEFLQDDLGLTYIFISHDLGVVKHICDRVAVMYAGRIVEIGPTEAIFGNPKHPYTKSLLEAILPPDPGKRKVFSLSGETADPGNLPPGCSFSTRCPCCRQECRMAVPELRETGKEHMVSCLLV